MAWQNADGLQVKYGADWRDKTVNEARAVSTLGMIKQIEMDFDLTKVAAGSVSYTADLNNDGTKDGFAGDIYIPANSAILRAYVVMTEAATSGGLATVAFGLHNADGTAIDADGIVTATAGAKANIDTVGDKLVGDGALVAFTSNAGVGIGSANGYVSFSVATAAFTAGKGKLVIEYV